MPYLTAIFLFIVGAWGKQLVKIIWYAVYHIPILILQAVASFFGSTVRIQLKKINAEDTFLYRFVQGLNFLDLFCIFFFICFCIDSEMFTDIIEDLGGLMVIGFVAPFFLTIYIHAVAPNKIKENREKEDKLEQYKYLVGREVVIIPGAVWSERDSFDNVMERGKPVRHTNSSLTVEMLGYYEGEPEARLSARYYKGTYDRYWIPAKYLKPKYYDEELRKQYSPLCGSYVRVLPGAIWGKPLESLGRYNYFFGKGNPVSDEDIKKTYIVMDVFVSKNIVMVKLREEYYGWVTVDNLQICGKT